MVPAPSPPSSQAINWWFEGGKILLTSALAIAGTGIWLGIWQHREKYIDDRINELIKEVDGAADLAVDYWKYSKSARGYRFGDAAKYDRSKDRAMEADLVSRVLRIGRMRSTVAPYLDTKKMKNLLEREGDLNMAFTGGDFKSPDRVCELNRFDMIRTEAAQYIGVVREARQARLEMNWWDRLWG
jgi:hypothetical protein